jgi:hypothetical protein
VVHRSNSQGERWPDSQRNVKYLWSKAAKEMPVRLSTKAQEEPTYQTSYYLTPLSINGKRESAGFVPDPFLGRGISARTTWQAGES